MLTLLVKKSFAFVCGYFTIFLKDSVFYVFFPNNKNPFQSSRRDIFYINKIKIPGVEFVYDAEESRFVFRCNGVGYCHIVLSFFL